VEGRVPSVDIGAHDPTVWSGRAVQEVSST
jgi:hypothetical protein